MTKAIITPDLTYPASFLPPEGEDARWDPFYGSRVLTKFPVTIKWDDKELHQNWMVGYTNKEHYPERFSGAELSSLLKNTIEQGLIKFEQYNSWPVFEVAEAKFSDYVSFEENDDSTVKGIEVNLVEHLHKHLNDSVAYIEEYRKSWKLAEDYLYKNAETTAYWGNHQLLREAARTLTEILKCSGDNMMGAWNREKSSSLLHSVEEVIKRKDTNNHNYKVASDTIRSVAYNANFPEFWSSKPHGQMFSEDE